MQPRKHQGDRKYGCFSTVINISRSKWALWREPGNPLPGFRDRFSNKEETDVVTPDPGTGLDPWQKSREALDNHSCLQIYPVPVKGLFIWGEEKNILQHY